MTVDVTDAVTHPRQPPRRGAARPGAWWSKALVRALEEAAYGEAELRRARSLLRGGMVGAVTVQTGAAVAAVADGDDAFPATLSLPPLSDTERQIVVELVAAETGRIAALLAGDLPHRLVEHGEESGVELLPYGGELGASCGCDAWLDPCVHALAVGYQVAWLMDADPLVLLHLRGLSREALLAGLHDLGPAAADTDAEADPDLDVALEAAERAAALLATDQPVAGDGSGSGSIRP